MSDVKTIPASKRGQCVDCGKAVWKSATSAPTQICRPCRKARAETAHGSDSRYRSGCRCNQCKAAVAERQRAYQAQRRATPTETTRCTEQGCGRPHKGHGLCSMHLRRKQKADGTWKPSPSDAWDTPARLANYKRRKALVRGGLATGDRFTVLDLIERDGRNCGICGEPMPETVYPDPMSPSIDHIEPLSLGGQHTLDNARATHLRCNIARGARV